MRRTSLLLLAIVIACGSARAVAPWVATWVGTWAAAPMADPIAAEKQAAADTTYRNIVHVSQGGEKIRLVLSNDFGKGPLVIGGVHVAFHDSESSTIGGTDHVVKFGGQESVTIPPGQSVSSDGVKMTVPIFSDLVVSVFVPAQKMEQRTYHADARSRNYTAPGNQAAAMTLDNATVTTSWYWLKAVEVKEESSKQEAVVTLGDSITDSAFSTVDANRRWPDALAVRLATNKKTKYLSVLNVGIGGNRILNDIRGQRALDRFDRDVLGQNGVKYLIILEGINDIGHTMQPNAPYQPVTAEQIIDGMKQMVEKAHAHGIKVVGATLTPDGESKYYSELTEAMRAQVNAWIRARGSFDGVIDFDKATLDPDHPMKFLPRYDHGDHLHPNDAGYQAMADAIDLKLFEEKK